jgi:hypothetical protein
MVAVACVIQHHQHPPAPPAGAGTASLALPDRRGSAVPAHRGLRAGRAARRSGRVRRICQRTGHTCGGYRDGYVHLAALPLGCLAGSPATAPPRRDRVRVCAATWTSTWVRAQVIRSRSGDLSRVSMPRFGPEPGPRPAADRHAPEVVVLCRRQPSSGCRLEVMAGSRGGGIETQWLTYPSALVSGHRPPAAHGQMRCLRSYAGLPTWPGHRGPDRSLPMRPPLGPAAAGSLSHPPTRRAPGGPDGSNCRLKSAAATVQ